MFNSKNGSWKVFVALLGVIALLFVAGCGGSDDGAAPEEAGEAPEAPAPAAPAIDGERHETETVSMIIADGWDVMDISGGLQAYKGNSAVEVWVRGSGLSDDDARAAMESMADSYDGTDVVELENLGLTFYSTTFEFGGSEQTKMSAVKDGARIEIGVTGPGYQDDPEIIGMLDSIIIN